MYSNKLLINFYLEEACCRARATTEASPSKFYEHNTNAATHFSQLQRSKMSDSSLIQAPSLKKDKTSERSDKDGNSESRKDWTLKETVLDAIAAFLKFLFDSAVAFVAAFITAIMTQDNVQTAFSSLIVRAMNEFMDQPDFGDKFDSAVRRVIYDKDRRIDASRDIGREVVPLVTGFVGGVADSIRPNIMKRKTTKKVVKKDHSGGSDMDTSAVSALTDVTIEEEVEVQVAGGDKKSK